MPLQPTSKITLQTKNNSSAKGLFSSDCNLQGQLPISLSCLSVHNDHAKDRTEIQVRTGDSRKSWHVECSLLQLALLHSVTTGGGLF